MRVGDISVDKRARRFALMMHRFRWESAGEKGPYERIRSAISFESVLSVKSRKIRTEAPDALAALLAVQFVPDEEPPGGTVHLVLAGGGEFELKVECLDATLFDFGEAWRTPRRPDHEQQ